MKKLKVLALVSVIGGASLSGAVMAEITGNLGVTSNYMWRGTTQTAGAAAVSGGIDYVSEVGIYAGVWTSNTSFDSPETDYYGGYAGNIGSFTYDVSIIDYTYSQADNIDWVEIDLGGGIAGFSFNLGITSDIFGTSTDALYIEGAYDIPLSETLTLTLHLGSYDFDDEAAAGFDSYIDYSATLTSGDWSFGFTDTDLNSNRFDDGDFLFVVSWGMEVGL